MKFRIVLLLLLCSSIFLRAQEPYENLIFSEVRMDQSHHAYFELCNMGDQAVDLSEFEFGNVAPWSSNGDTYPISSTNHIMLPSVTLNPGETYVVAIVREWANEQALLDPEVESSVTKNDTWLLADLKLHASESSTDDPTDSITPGYQCLDIWNGYYAFYLRHHYSETDSVVVDAVNNIFTGDNGTRPDYNPSDVAGVSEATVNSILVRKYSITKGNTDWEQARGVDIEDSEWLPVPILVSGGWEKGRKEFWTMGNHEDCTIDQTNLISETIVVDWTNNTMTCDWGVRRMDSIMNEFEKVPGVAWHYYQSVEGADSAYNSVRAGDSLVLYACGSQLQIASFDIIATDATASEARVIPKNKKDDDSWYTPYIVSANESGDDVISNVEFGTRVDTLYKYLEKADAATWEIVFVDGVERPEIVDGDILKVTSGDATTVKEYTIETEPYIPSHNANLASITWPDIPEDYFDLYGWNSDTIPNFSPTKFNYNLEIPLDVDGIPALATSTENIDASVTAQRAGSLSGLEADRTVTYTIVAEDDTTINTYNVILTKEKDAANVQPYNAEPFFSQFVEYADWSNSFLEICNPGNQPLDLSNYCIVATYNDIASAITESSTTDDFASRYNRYVPGRVWQDEANWLIQPSMLEQDFSVNAIVPAGDVFVMADAENELSNGVTPYPDFDEIDVNFRSGETPWGIELESNLVDKWYTASWALYKITNDSVINGLKPLNDPYDVELIDVIGNFDGSNIGYDGMLEGYTYDQNSGMKRRPEVYNGNPDPGASFGDGTAGTSEWIYTNSSYWSSEGYSWPYSNSMSSDGIGSHEFNTVTEYLSTITSNSYTVSEGYSMNETVSAGVVTGTTVAEFIENIDKADEGQTLTFTSNDTELESTDVLADGTVLTVVSANGDNTSAYTITVADQGFDTDALLTSEVYTIEVTGAEGTITGFEVGTTLKEVYDSVTAPATISQFTLFYENGSYAPFTELKLDTNYYDAIASDEVYFEVIAQDKVTSITYQLMPTSASTDCYVLSSVYYVDQENLVIRFVPGDISATSLLANLIPAPGATMQLVNKLYQERTVGTIYEDDIVIVTAADGTTQKEYTLETLGIYAERSNALLYSDTWDVSNQTMIVTGPVSSTTVEAFLGALWVSDGATFALYDTEGNAVTTGSLENDTYTVVVTSESGYENSYAVIVDKTSVSVIDGTSISVYPNPTSGAINFSGVNEGQTITIYNSIGRQVKSLEVTSSLMNTSLENFNSGLYLVVISENSQRVAQFKMLKK